MTSSTDQTHTDRGAVLRGSAASVAAPADLFRPLDSGVEPTGLWRARAEAAEEESRATGYAEGFARGRADGLAAAREEARQESATAIAAVDRLVAELRETDRRIGDDFGDETTGFALAAVEAILSRELAVATDPGLEAIARCLSVGPEIGAIEARLHPEDIKTLGHVEEITGDRAFTLVPDSSLQRGDALVTVGETTIDGRLAAALDRLRDALV